MPFSFRPANSINERHGVFVALTGGPNSGKSWSALRLARGLAGPTGRIAAIDTEGGRLLHLKKHFEFDPAFMGTPFRPMRFAEGAKQAEDEGFAALLIDSFSQEWCGIGGVLDWQEEELSSMVARAKARNDKRTEYQIREAGKMAAWIKPKSAHKAMVYSFLQRRIPIIFSIRGEESVKPGESGGTPIKTFKSICSQTFPFEMTVAFRLSQDRKGYIDLSDPKSWKMEEAHQEIFHDGDRISEEHGAKLAAWARGEGAAKPAPTIDAETIERAKAAAAALMVRFGEVVAQDQLRGLVDEDGTGKMRQWLNKHLPELGAEVQRSLDAALERVTAGNAEERAA